MTDYALSVDEQRHEMETLNKVWNLMRDLDTPARFRVIEWLSSWARQEAPKGSYSTDF